jgi:hypothetical protein
MTDTETTTIEQPVTSVTEQPVVDPQPTPTLSTVQKMQSGKGMQRPQVRRIEGKNGTPTSRADGTRPSTQVTPTTQPIQAPVVEQTPVATVIPVTQQSSVQQPAEQHTGPRILQPTNPDDLIQIPGEEKPLTLNQLKSDRGKMRTMDQKEGQLNYREQQLSQKQRELDERERNLATRPTAQFQQPQTPVQQSAVDQSPARPAGAIEGDDDWAKWQADLITYNVDKAIEKRLAPMMDSINQTKAEKEANEKAQSEGIERFRRNDLTLTSAIRENLPFDPIGLSEEVYNKVWEKIRTTAMDLDPRYDFTDKSKMTSIEIDPAVTKAAIKLAFPPGSLPPGYTAQMANPMTQAAADERPLVPASPKKQLPNTITDSVPSKDVTAKGPPGAKPSWHERLRGNNGQLEPVTYRRSG